MRLTMDYEKAYKNALERARKINSGEGVPAPPGYSVCETIFPELKESEDERIRKELISFFTKRDEFTKSEPFNGLSSKQIIAWLEKQGEQKPAWSEEDEEMIDFMIKFIESLFYWRKDLTKRKDEVLSWLKSIKPQPSWKPTEEQMEALNAINNVGELSYVKQSDLLIKLYNDLKKL